MTKLDKVISFVRNKKNSTFTMAKFVRHMGKYPAIEVSYLTMLVRTKYIQRTSKRKYQVNITPGHGISLIQLKNESKMNWS